MMSIQKMQPTIMWYRSSAVVAHREYSGDGYLAGFHQWNFSAVATDPCSIRHHGVKALGDMSRDQNVRQYVSLSSRELDRLSGGCRGCVMMIQSGCQYRRS